MNGLISRRGFLRIRFLYCLTGVFRLTGRLLLRVTSNIAFVTGLEVSLVPTFALQTKLGCRKHFAQRRLATVRAVDQLRVTHLLQRIKRVFAAVAGISVDRHVSKLHIYRGSRGLAIITQMYDGLPG